ncbi:hypothetical protein V5F32_14315 [Xanthobacter oligotrophicus]|uniref:Uncharacterized protein n=1 Tax=Xanthobacter oligotrophicus TaxID=2607286 RepID=A0ABW6ZX81_9HYPH
MTIFMDRSLFPDADAPQMTRFGCFLAAASLSGSGRSTPRLASLRRWESSTVPSHEDGDSACLFLGHATEGRCFAADSPLFLPIY